MAPAIFDGKGSGEYCLEWLRGFSPGVAPETFAWHTSEVLIGVGLGIFAWSGSGHLYLGWLRGFFWDWLRRFLPGVATGILAWNVSKGLGMTQAFIPWVVAGDFGLE